MSAGPHAHRTPTARPLHASGHAVQIAAQLAAQLSIPYCRPSTPPYGCPRPSTARHRKAAAALHNTVHLDTGAHQASADPAFDVREPIGRSTCSITAALGAIDSDFTVEIPGADDANFCDASFSSSEDSESEEA